MDVRRAPRMPAAATIITPTGRRPESCREPGAPRGTHSFRPRGSRGGRVGAPAAHSDVGGGGGRLPKQKSNHLCIGSRAWLPRRSAKRRSTSSASTGSRRSSQIPGRRRSPSSPTFPDDLRFVLGLHESSVVGMATGWAIGRGKPALAILHTTPGLGNAVSALATARVNRAPLVVVVGQQDRRHIATEPFLAGRLHGPGGRLPGLGRPAGARPGCARRDRPRVPRGDDGAGAGRRHRADGRLDGGSIRSGRAGRGPSRCSRPGSRRGRRLGARGAPRRGREPRARRRGGGGRSRHLGRARRAGRATRLPCLAGAVQRPRRLPAGSRALRGPPAGRPDTAAPGARAARRRALRRRPGVPAVPVRARARSSSRGRGSRW